MQSNLLTPPNEQRRDSSSLDSLTKPANPDPFTSLAECLRQLPSDLADRLSPLAAQFSVKRLGTALRKASVLVNDVAQRAPAVLGVEATMNVLEATSRVESDVRTAVDFASRLVSGNTLGASTQLTRTALEHLLDSISEGVARVIQLSKTLSMHHKPTSSVRDVLQRVRAAASSTGEAVPTILGEDVAHLARPSHVEIARVPPYRPCSHVQTVAEVVSAQEGLELDKILLTISARFVGKDGDVYSLRIPAYPIKLDESDDRANDLVLRYSNESGFTRVGCVANYTITGVKGAHASSVRITRYPLTGADVATSGALEEPLEVSYRSHHTPEAIGGSVVSELLGISGARTALPPFLAQVIERTRALPQEERVQVLCSAFFKRDYVYSKDDSLHALIDNLPKPIRLSFLAGLRIGSCETMSLELQNFLALAGIPAIVEGGALYDPERHAFCTPGHARVRCLTDPQLVIDPTRWTTSEFEVNAPSDSLSHEILTKLSGQSPADAFALGVTLRDKLLYTPQPNGGNASHSVSREIRGHNLSDDFERRSLFTYQWDIETEAAQLAWWSELIQEEVKHGNEAFFSMFHCSNDLYEFLEQSNEPVIAGSTTLFTDWVSAYLHHPRKAVAECVRFPIFDTFTPGDFYQKVHENAWATFLFLADQIDPRATRGWGEGPLGGDRVRQFLTTFVHRDDAEVNTCKVEELFVRVAVKHLKAWSTYLHESAASEDEEAFAGFARRLIELSTSYSPNGAGLLQQAVADTLKDAVDGALLALLAGINGRLVTNDNYELEIRASLDPVSQSMRYFLGQFFPHLEMSPDRPVRTFERSRDYLDIMFRERVREAVDQRLSELTKRELGRPGIHFCPLVRRSGENPAYFLPEHRRSFDAFSLYIGGFLNYYSESDFVRFSQSDTFKKALRSASLEVLAQLLSEMQTLANNLPDCQQRSLAPVFTDFIGDLLEEFSITLDERSALIRGRDAILSRGIHSPASEWFIPNSTDTSSTKVASRLAELLKANVIQEDRLSAYERPVADSRVASEVCDFLTEELQNFDRPRDGLLCNLMKIGQANYSALVPTRWVPLVLQSLKEQIAALPSPLAEAVRAVEDIIITDEDRALWKALETHTPDQVSILLGTLPDSSAAEFLSRVIIDVLNPDTCTNILTYTFLMGLEGNEIEHREPRTNEIMQQAVRRFLPSITSENHIRAVSDFLCEFSGRGTTPPFLLWEFARRVPFTNLRVLERLRELQAAEGGPVRAHLWRLTRGYNGPDIEAPPDTPLISPNLWRSALGRAVSHQNQKTVRSLLGSPDPYEVEGLSRYSRGDDVRHIDWRASARGDHLYVKRLERSRPVDARTIAVCVDRSDMGYSTADGSPVLNVTFVDDLIGFLRSMIVDGKNPSLTLFSYGVPDSALSPSQVRSLFFDNDAGTARSMLIRDARQAARSAHIFGCPETVARACSTVAREAEPQMLEVAKTSLILMLTSSADGRSRDTAPSTRIWCDPFSLHLMERGKAVRIEL